MDNNAKPFGPGRIILIVGPSGSGKDTLIAGVKERLRHDPRFVFPRREITRQADPASEDHATLTREAFESQVATGTVGLSWEAHDKGYIIPRHIRDDVAAGRFVVFNGSRAAVPDAQAIFAHVDVILIAVDQEVLAKRLVERNRESADDIARRLERASLPVDPAWRVVRNDGSVEQGVDRLADAITACCEAGGTEGL